MDKRGARSRWAAIGAACAVTLGGGGLFTASAATGTGERATFVAITPCRIMDTREGADNRGPRSTPIGPSETHTIPVLGTNGDCTIPADATSVALNVTALRSTSDSYLTVFPAGVTRPTASNLNWVAGQAPTPNAVTADLPADGRLSFFNLAGSVDVIADITGYYVDHHHDDRYYTKQQIDVALAEKQDAPAGQGFVILGIESFAEAKSTLASDWQVDFSALTITATSGAPCFNAPVDLPDGAIVTGFEVRYIDNDGASPVFLLRANRYAAGPNLTMAAGSPFVMSTAEQTFSTTTITSPNVDNGVFTYAVSICLIPNASLLGAKVTYTV